MLDIKEAMAQITKELNRYGTIVDDVKMEHKRETTYKYQNHYFIVEKSCGETVSILMGH